MPKKTPQYAMCSGQKDLVKVILEGASEGSRECQKSFKNDIWNCSVDYKWLQTGKKTGIIN